jgi:hypothetical protein
MSKLSSKLKEEFLALLPPTIYFFVALHIVAFVRVLMLKGTGIAPSSSISDCRRRPHSWQGGLLADMLPLINRFPNKPLIYNVAWKTVIYWLIRRHSLPGTPDRFLARDRQLCRRQRKVTFAHHLAALLGDPDHSC